jgi:hypothetical protein
MSPCMGLSARVGELATPACFATLDRLRRRVGIGDPRPRRRVGVVCWLAEDTSVVAGVVTGVVTGVVLSCRVKVSPTAGR